MRPDIYEQHAAKNAFLLEGRNYGMALTQKSKLTKNFGLATSLSRGKNRRRNKSERDL